MLSLGIRGIFKSLWLELEDRFDFYLRFLSGGMIGFRFCRVGLSAGVKF